MRAGQRSGSQCIHLLGWRFNNACFAPGALCTLTKARLSGAFGGLTLASGLASPRTASPNHWGPERTERATVRGMSNTFPIEESDFGGVCMRMYKRHKVTERPGPAGIGRMAEQTRKSHHLDGEGFLGQSLRSQMTSITVLKFNTHTYYNVYSEFSALYSTILVTKFRFPTGGKNEYIILNLSGCTYEFSISDKYAYVYKR